MQSKPFEVMPVDATGGLLLATTPVLEKINFLFVYLGVKVTCVKLVAGFWELTLELPNAEMVARFSETDMNALQIADAQIAALVFNVFMQLCSLMAKAAITAAIAEEGSQCSIRPLIAT
jgi:hypothetical protein